METQISTWKMIKSDHWAFISFVYFLIFFGGFGYFFLTEGDIEIKSYSALVLMFLFIFVPLIGFVMRTRKIKSIFENGNKTTAIINNVSFFRWKGTVTYVFEYRNERYLVKNFIVKNGNTKELSTGQAVEIYHSVENPKSAVIEFLFKKDD